MRRETDMVEVPEEMRDILKDLVSLVALHRQGGGTLDNLPARQQALLQALDKEERHFFMEELARADAEAGLIRFRTSLSRWRAAKGASGTRPEGTEAD
jgi:hypothetical protein